jgi:signal transduction histidine kinase
MAIPDYKPQLQHIYRLLFKPHGEADDLRRREFVLNVLLCGLAMVACLRLLSSAIHHQPMGFDQEEDALLANGIFLIIVLGLWRLARHGRQRIAALSLLGILSLAAVQLTLRWSFELPIAELMYALVIVVAGILLAARAALVVTGFISVLLLGISYGQIAHYLHPQTNWVRQDFQMADVIGYVAVLCLIALVSWLTNREINRSLGQAYASEAALAKERDSLEIKVHERTRELEQAQLLRTVELQRLAEFGRLSANLLHEIANPLTAASLNLEQCDGRKSRLVTQALRNLQQLERYLEAARKQLKANGKLGTFPIRHELHQIARIMAPLARQAGVKLNIEQSGNCNIYGDPVKFNQLVANLIANALDAYKDSALPASQKHVVVTVKQNGRWLDLQVADRGKGIAPEELPYLFDTFYTTKGQSGHGLGIGLAIVKQYVTIDFRGSIKVNSSNRLGTQFTAKLRALPR